MSVVTVWKKFQKDWKNEPFKTVPKSGRFFLFSIIGLGGNETVGEEQEKRWEMKRMKKGEQGK